ncbi:MBL fold metallo-hydrolase [Nocardioides panacis]|uniref:MBL fold metallo-hydrolase n=1 Tax=Nocardioides panacis TaxID=2849501 RepID=A0A975SXR2_9ACTN|nr:MBL fold metallo-hydrolase [Nocardioides panacis]QWZ07737.1 MBL fold metallo-hydrolase [Nocardioides panacis]
MTTTLDWYGCATFGLRTAGMHILLDAYVDRAATAAGPGLRAEDITDCDWIVIGHAHFDHLYGAERIAPATGARIVAGYESVRLLEALGVPLEQMVPVAGGETVDLGNGCRVTAYPSQHSCVWSHGQMPQAGEVCLGDLGVTWQEQQTRMQALTRHLATALDPVAGEHLQAALAGHSDRGDGGALLFLFELPDGSLLFQDTSGHWSGVLAHLRPDVAILAAAGRGNVDGEPVQGTLADFVARQAELLGAPRILLSHHDDWLPGFSVDTDLVPVRAALARRCPEVELLEPGYCAGTVLFG